MAFQFRTVLCFVPLVLTFSSFSRILLTGDSAATSTTSFSFTVSEHVMNGEDKLFVGRFAASDNASADNIRQYSLSSYAIGAAAFGPLAPATIMLDKVENQANPMIGKKIQTLSTVNGMPVCVLADTPQHLYAVLSVAGANPFAVASLQNIKDAQGATNSAGSTTAGIIKLASTGSCIFAQVKKNGGNWGDVGSGIALITLNTGVLTQLAAIANDTGIKAVPFDTNSAFITAGATTPTLVADGVTDMYWDDSLQRLYITCRVTATSGGATIGVRAVVMGYFNTTGNLVLTDFLPGTSALTGVSKIVGAYNTSGTITAHIRMFRTLQTSTGAFYGIVLGNATGFTTQSTVYALPLVDKRRASPTTQAWLTDTAHGTLASKSINAGTNLKTYYDTGTGTTPTPFLGRAFQTAATVANDMTLDTDLPALVGGGVAPGIVNDMVTSRDTVFISVANSSTNASGIYSSQAIFDSNGAIKGWTPWTKVMVSATSTNQIYGFGVASLGRFVTLQGTLGSTINTAELTSWGNAGNDGLFGGVINTPSTALTALLDATFDKTIGGIQGLFDFSKDTASFRSSTPFISYLIATGYKKILLAETGNDSTGLFTYKNDYTTNPIQTFTNGTINVTTSAAAIVVSGGALDSLGAITSAAIAKSGLYGYLLVAGEGGLVVLRAASRNGWTITDMNYQLTGALTSKTFVTIGSYKNVRKIVVDDVAGQVYIVTPSQIDRIASSDLNAVTVPAVTIATPSDLTRPPFIGSRWQTAYASFTDLIVSGKLALLGTTCGLYRTGNGANTATASTASAMNWTVITFPEWQSSVVSMQGVAITSFEYDISQQAPGGNVYVLLGSPGRNSACVYRLTVANTASTAISDASIALIPDYIMSGIISPFVFLPEYKNYFYTTGSFYLTTRSQNDTVVASSQCFGRGWNGGFLNSHMIVAAIPLVTTKAVTELLKPIRCSAFGSLIVPTNGQIQVLE